MTMTTQVRFDDVSFSYGGPVILEGVNLQIENGEFLGVVGPNAGGKSTLIKLMLGLLTPTSGRVTVLGQSPRSAAKMVGYCPQLAPFSRDFPISVEEVVFLGRLGKTDVEGNGQTDRKAVEEAMATTELSDIRHRRIGTLSGGELQRVLVARALACEPAMLVLDEPTANIDLRVEGDIFDLLRRLNQRMTVVVVSHDIGFISGYVSRVACVNRTVICHHTAELTGENVAELYGGHVSMIEHIHP